jgi:Protein of unknown function (DUF581).
MRDCDFCNKPLCSYVFEGNRIFCSETCRKKHLLSSVTYRYPCSICGGQIYIMEGIYIQGKNVYCSLNCVNNK